MEIELKLENCREKNRSMSVAVHRVCMEELADVWAKGFDMASGISKYGNQTGQ
jgi:hypothetical protein